MQPQAPGRTPQALGAIALLLLKNLAEAIGTNGGLVLGLQPLQPLHPLLDQHLGHVAERAGFGFGQGRQAITELFRQHHLNAG